MSCEAPRRSEHHLADLNRAPSHHHLGPRGGQRGQRARRDLPRPERDSLERLLRLLHGSGRINVAHHRDHHIVLHVVLAVERFQLSHQSDSSRPIHAVIGRPMRLYGIELKEQFLIRRGRQVVTEQQIRPFNSDRAASIATASRVAT